MPLTLTTRWRRRLSLAILAIANRLPAGHSAIVDRLQGIANERRDEARRVVEGVSSLPYSLKYVGLSLVELFPSELRDDVEDGARALFPFLERKRETTNPNVMRSGRLGRLYRTRPAGVFIPRDSYALLPTLPPWVAYVDINISQEYASSFIVTANIVTNELVDDLICNQIKMETPGDIEFLRLGNLLRFDFARTRYSAKRAYAAGFQRLLSSLRYDVQRAVFGRLRPRGYFLTHEHDLPAIELMQVVSEGAPSDDWISETSTWRGALDLRIDRDYYAGETVLLSVGEEIDSHYPPVWRIVFTPEYQPPVVGHRDDSRNGVALQIQEHLVGTLHGLAFKAHQDVVASLLARFRRRVLLSRRQRFNIPAQTGLYEEILEERIFFLRLKREFADEHWHIEPNDFLRGLRYRTVFLPTLQQTEPGDVGLRERTIRTYDLLGTGIDEIRSFYSDLLPARNFRATNILAWTALCIALLSLVNGVTIGFMSRTGTAPQASKSPVATARPRPAPKGTKPQQPVRPTP